MFLTEVAVKLLQFLNKNFILHGIVFVIKGILISKPVSQSAFHSVPGLHDEEVEDFSSQHSLNMERLKSYRYFDHSYFLVFMFYFKMMNVINPFHIFHLFIGFIWLFQ